MVIFKRGAIFLCCIRCDQLRSNTTTNFRPAARAYSQRYHLLLLHNMLSKLVKDDENFPPRKKAKSGPGYAAE